MLAVPWTRTRSAGVTALTPGRLASSPTTVAGTVAANPATIGRALVTCPPSRRTASSGAASAAARFCTMTRMGSVPGRDDPSRAAAPIPVASLEGRLRALHATDAKKRVMLKADTTVPYKRVRETFALLQTVGFHGVALRVAKRGAKPGEA